MQQSLTDAHGAASHGEHLVSPQDSTALPEDIAKKAAANNMGVCSTEHGTLASVHAMSHACKRHGVPYTPGCEFYYVPDVRDPGWRKTSKSRHITVIAASNKGYHNLMRLQWFANNAVPENGGYIQRPRIDFKALARFNEDLFVLSGCIGGVIGGVWQDALKADSKSLIEGSEKAAFAAMIEARKFQQLLGDRFHLELQRVTYEQGYWKAEIDSYNKVLFEIHKTLGIPMVATLDSHYVERDHSFATDLLFTTKLGRKLTDPIRSPENPKGRLSAAPGSLCFEDLETVNKRFLHYGEIGRQALKNTVTIMENCNVDIQWKSDQLHMPHVDLQARSDFKEFLQFQQLVGDCDCFDASAAAVAIKALEQGTSVQAIGDDVARHNGGPNELDEAMAPILREVEPGHICHTGCSH